MPIDQLIDVFSKNSDHYLVKQLSSNMSFGPLNLLWTHDLNNHLTIALSNLDRASKQIENPVEAGARIEKALTALRKISQQCHVMTNLLSRGTDRELSADELASSIEDFFGSNLAKNLIQVKINNKSGELKLPGQITQYLWICHIAVSNAKNAFYDIEDDREPKIEFDLSNDNDYFTFSIEDNGPGIKTELLESWQNFFDTKGKVPVEEASGFKQLFLLSNILKASTQLTSTIGQGHKIELKIPL